MEFSYDESFGEPSDEGYVRLLADAMLSDPTLFTRSDEVEAAWRLYTPLLELIEDSPGSCRFIPTNPAPGDRPPRTPCWRRTDCSGDAPDRARSQPCFQLSTSRSSVTMSPQLTLQTPLELAPAEVPHYLEQLWSPEQQGSTGTGANTFCLLIWRPPGPSSN